MTEQQKTIEGNPKSPLVKERLISLDVIVERRDSRHKWQKHSWHAIAVEPAGGSEPAHWREIERGDGYVRYLACSLDLDMHRKETEGYKYNLAGAVPSVYVALRPSGDRDFPWQPVDVSVCPYDALSATEMGDDQVDAVPMGTVVETLVRNFVDRHHVDQPFLKRKRKGRDKKLGETSDFRMLDYRLNGDQPANGNAILGDEGRDE